MVPIWTVYIFSIKCRHRYPNRFSISSPIGPLYMLSIINLYRYLYTKSIGLPIRLPIKGLYILVFPMCDGKDDRNLCPKKAIAELVVVICLSPEA